MNTTIKDTFLIALKMAAPVAVGFIPTGIAYALFAASKGISGLDILLSSMLVYGGSVQFIAVDLVASNMGYAQFAIVVFLVHSRHLFYGLSVFDQFDKTGKAKPFMIFCLSDELYALLTGTKAPKEVKEGNYYICLAVIAYFAWVLGTALGVFATEFVRFDTTGMDFALTALFLVILTEQIQGAENKIPFFIGGGTALVSMLVLGAQSMLLGCAVLSVILLLALRSKIEATQRGGAD